LRRDRIRHYVGRRCSQVLGCGKARDMAWIDIKPANLIRTQDGVTKVVDFGLARGQDTNMQLTQQGTLLGTPAYMAPEQWTGSEVDGRSDLYSLRCTYYFLLTGRLPFDAPADVDSSPPQAVRSGGIGAPSTPTLLSAKSAPSPASRSKVEVPSWFWTATSAAADHLKTEVTVNNSIGMSLRLIPPGEFLMESADGEAERESGETLHRTRISRP